MDLARIILTLCQIASVQPCPAVEIVDDFPGMARVEQKVHIERQGAIMSRRIAISRKLHAEIRNESEMACVLGHELGHVIAGHGAFHPITGGPRETEADMLALSILERTPYRCLSCADLLARLGLKERAATVRLACRGR